MEKKNILFYKSFNKIKSKNKKYYSSYFVVILYEVFSVF